MFFWMVLVFLVAVAVAMTPSYQMVALKVRCYTRALWFMARANDLPPVYTGGNAVRQLCTAPPSRRRGGATTRTVRVIFVRHGQSTWNAVFNTFGLTWPLRLLHTLLHEMRLLVSDPFDSMLIDAPLSARGRREAQDLARFVRAARTTLPVDPATSLIVVSNLRRAMETALVGFASRLAVTHERIVVDSALQEGSRNVDAQTLSCEKGKLAPVRLGDVLEAVALPSCFDPCLNAGDKVIGADVYARMDVFLAHLFGCANGNDGDVRARGGAHGVDVGAYVPAAAAAAAAAATVVAAGTNAAQPPTRRYSNDDVKEVIVVGHSAFFRTFFRRFLPRTSTHVATRKKMENCAVVAFDLACNHDTGEVSIDEATLRVLYKGFK